jgi:lysyl-tRNA synthetase class 1
MDELNKLERIYFGLEKIADKRDSVNLKRLFEFVNLLKPPKKPSLHVAYNTWVEIAKILPEKNVVEFALKKLKEFGYVKKVDERIRKEVEQKISFARKWYEDFEKAGLLEKFEVPADVKPAIQELINLIIREKDGEKIQKEIFLIAKKHGLQPPEFFKIIYKILLQSERGPRLGPYIIERGKGEVIEKLREVL